LVKIPKLGDKPQAATRLEPRDVAFPPRASSLFAFTEDRTAEWLQAARQLLPGKTPSFSEGAGVGDVTLENLGEQTVFP